jgi:hypothetical protein
MTASNEPSRKGSASMSPTTLCSSSGSSKRCRTIDSLMSTPTTDTGSVRTIADA